MVFRTKCLASAALAALLLLGACAALPPVVDTLELTLTVDNESDQVAVLAVGCAGSAVRKLGAVPAETTALYVFHVPAGCGAVGVGVALHPSGRASAHGPLSTRDRAFVLRIPGSGRSPQARVG